MRLLPAAASTAPRPHLGGMSARSFVAGGADLIQNARGNATTTIAVFGGTLADPCSHVDRTCPEARPRLIRAEVIHVCSLNSHSIEVIASDGTLSSSTKLTITVHDVAESITGDGNPNSLTGGAYYRGQNRLRREGLKVVSGSNFPLG
jgi:hypothetical protein